MLQWSRCYADLEYRKVPAESSAGRTGVITSRRPRSTEHEGCSGMEILSRAYKRYARNGVRVYGRYIVAVRFQTGQDTLQDRCPDQHARKLSAMANAQDRQAQQSEGYTSFSCRARERKALAFRYAVRRGGRRTSSETDRAESRDACYRELCSVL